ncbi:hypothetical protein D3C78_1372730 [compost metagenome]
MQALQAHHQALVDRQQLETQAGRAQGLDNALLAAVQARAHDLRREATGPGLVIGLGLQLEADRALAGLRRRAHAPGQQPRGPGLRRQGLDPAVQFVAAGQAMKALHRPAQRGEPGAHHFFVHGLGVVHGAISRI